MSVHAATVCETSSQTRHVTEALLAIDGISQRAQITIPCDWPLLLSSRIRMGVSSATAADSTHALYGTVYDATPDALRVSAGGLLQVIPRGCAETLRIGERVFLHLWIDATSSCSP